MTEEEEPGRRMHDHRCGLGKKMRIWSPHVNCGGSCRLPETTHASGYCSVHIRTFPACTLLGVYRGLLRDPGSPLYLKESCCRLIRRQYTDMQSLSPVNQILYTCYRPQPQGNDKSTSGAVSTNPYWVILSRNPGPGAAVLTFRC